MALEDYTTYTEVDPATYLTVATNTVTFTNVPRSSDINLTKDKGAGYFGPSPFVHLLDFTVTAISSYGAMGVWGIADSVDDAASSVHAAVVFWYGNGNKLYLKVRGGSQDISIGLSIGTHYYLECEFNPSVGTYGTFYVRIYDDPARDAGSLKDTLSGAPNAAVNDRYIYAAVNYQLSGGTSISGTINNLDLQEGAASGWANDIDGIPAPYKIAGIAASSIAKVNGIAA